MIQRNKYWKKCLTLVSVLIFPVLVFAQYPQEQRYTVVQTVQEHEEEKISYDDEITVRELPDSIIDSYETTYAGYQAKKIYRGSNGSYKIVLEKEDEKIAAYYDTENRFLKIEEVKDDEININDDWR